MRALRDHRDHPEQPLPPLSEAACKFGHWLARPATLRRMEHLPAFADVASQHAALHQQASELFAHGVPDAGSWQGLAQASQRLLDELNQLKIQSTAYR